MSAASESTHVAPESWAEWIEECTIGNCTDEVRGQLAGFGRKRLGKALSRISSEVADLYCGPDVPPETAWLMVEECLYAGASMDSGKAGKAYKAKLIEGSQNSAHFEARLTLNISQVIARRILADEGYRLRQSTGVDGKRTATWWQMDALEEEPAEDIFIEPEDENAVEAAAAFHAQRLWDALPSSHRILAACQLCGSADIGKIEAAGLLDCRKSQLYNIRKSVHEAIESVDWGAECREPRQRAYMTRHLLTGLHSIITGWLKEVENSKARSFIESESRSEDR